MALFDKVFGKLIEQKASERLKEMAVYSTDEADEDAYNWRRLTTSERDLPTATQMRMIKIAHYLWVANPAARAIIETILDFCLGGGIQVTARSSEVQEVLDEFWAENHLDTRLEAKVRDLCLFGELLIPVRVNKGSGQVRLGNISPERIKAVTLDYFDEETPVEVTLSTSALGEEKKIKVIQNDEDASSSTYNHRVGDTFYFTVNRCGSMTRGMSDLLHVADWLDAQDKFLFTMLENWALQASFVWDVTLENAQPPDIETFLKANRKVTPGSVRAHNETVKWSAVSPDLDMADASSAFRLLKSMVLWGTQIPETWTGVGEFANRSSAENLGDPAIKRLSRRQKYVIAIIKEILDFVVDQAILAKRIKPPTNIEKRQEYLSYKILVPEMNAKDTSRIAAAFAQIITGLREARNEGWITDITATQTIANLITGFGVSIDAEKEAQEAGENKSEAANV